MTRHVRAVSLLLAAICLCSPSETYQEEKEFDGVLTSEEIFVNTEDGRTLSVTIEPNDIVQDLKRKIQDIDGTPANRMKLQLGVDWLIVGRKLKSRPYNVTAGRVVTMILNEDEGYSDTLFFVQNLKGDRLEVRMPLGRPVARLMETIARWTGIPKWQQRILCNGKLLEPERRLLSYGILWQLENPTKQIRPAQPITTLRLGAPLESCRSMAKILVKTLSGTTIPIEIELTQTATNLKKTIYANTGVPMVVQQLVFQQQILAGEDHLCDYGLGDGSSVYMVLASSLVDTPEKVAILVEADNLPSKSADPESPYKTPIFHEADDATKPKSSQPEVAIYKNVRNWVFERCLPAKNITILFEPNQLNNSD